jgi:hypothetical protein
MERIKNTFTCRESNDVPSHPTRNSFAVFTTLSWIPNLGLYTPKICACADNYKHNRQFDIRHSEDRASWHIIIIKSNEMHYFSDLFWYRTLHVSDRFTVHHQESSTVYTAIGICHTSYVDGLLAYSQHNGRTHRHDAFRNFAKAPNNVGLRV